MLYIIQGTVTIDYGVSKGVALHSSIRQVPTFLLDSDIQGIRNEDDAIRVARSIILMSTTRLATRVTNVSVTVNEYTPRLEPVATAETAERLLP